MEKMPGVETNHEYPLDKQSLKEKWREVNLRKVMTSGKVSRNPLSSGKKTR